MSSEFASAIAKKYLNKYVEIYQGDSEDTRLQSEINTDTKSVIYGKIVEVDGPAIIISVRNGNKEHEIMINSWSIRTICESSKYISIYDIYRADVDLANLKRKGKVIA